MGILQFPRIHARASSTSASLRAASSANASSVTSPTLRSAANATTPAQCGAGMPRVCQPLTVESDCPSAPATAPVPPRATMIDFQDAMSGNIVRTVRTSQGFATSETTNSHRYGAVGPEMDQNHIIAGRLRALRRELGEREGIHGGYNQTQFAEKLDLTKSTYNPFETGKRTLTFETACLIRRRFGIPVDWLFFGDMPKIDNEVLFKLGPEPSRTVRKKRIVANK